MTVVAWARRHERDLERTFRKLDGSFVHWYEEPALRQQFGTDYENYLRTVPGWWPRRLRRPTG